MNISHPRVEGRLEVSRWISFGIIVSPDEMRQLFSKLSPSNLVQVGSVCKEDEALLSEEAFLSAYETYIDSYKKGAAVPFRLAPAITRSISSHYLMQVRPEQFLVKGTLPSIQVQHHQFSFSKDGRLLPMALDKDAISWGAQFSYPQIFRDPKTGQIHQTQKMPLENTALFSIIRRFVRDHTAPLKLLIDGKKKAFPIRISPNVLSWIDLSEQGLEVIK